MWMTCCASTHRDTHRGTWSIASAICFFAGDIMHGAALQLIDPTICARYDSDPGQSIKTRNTILDYAVANSLTVLGAHIPANGVLF